MLELYKTTRLNIASGNYPLNHDCLIKVVYCKDCNLVSDYFTCRCQESGQLLDILSKFSAVQNVFILPSHEFHELW